VPDHPYCPLPPLRPASGGRKFLRRGDGFPPCHPRAAPSSTTLTAAAAERIRREIARAGGNEVCFVCSVADGGVVDEPRTLARRHASAVLELLREALAMSDPAQEIG
jgi:hypothetical protein